MDPVQLDLFPTDDLPIGNRLWSSHILRIAHVFRPEEVDRIRDGIYLPDLDLSDTALSQYHPDRDLR